MAERVIISNIYASDQKGEKVTTPDTVLNFTDSSLGNHVLIIGRNQTDWYKFFQALIDPSSSKEFTPDGARRIPLYIPTKGDKGVAINGNNISPLMRTKRGSLIFGRPRRLERETYYVIGEVEGNDFNPLQLVELI